MSVDIERVNSVSITDGILRCRCLKLSRYLVNREFLLENINKLLVSTHFKET